MNNNPTITEMDKVIAEFMGYYYHAGKFYSQSGGTGKWFKEAKYQTSWNWLMPVVEKIEKEYAHVRIQVGICAITHKFMSLKRIAKDQGVRIEEVMPIAEHNEYDFIGNVYHSVYDFIQWYNQQNRINASKN